jgi:hypothetical protein
MSRGDERENGGGAAGEMAKVNRVNQSSGPCHYSHRLVQYFHERGSHAGGVY